MAYTYYKSYYGVVVNKNKLVEKFLYNLMRLHHDDYDESELDEIQKEINDFSEKDEKFSLGGLLELLKDEDKFFAGEFYEGNLYIGVFTGQCVDWNIEIIEGFSLTEENKKDFEKLISLLPSKIKVFCHNPKHTWQGMSS